MRGLGWTLTGAINRCFLFLVNYARLEPEKAQRALPILLEDMKDGNPLVRALALRTISYIHVKEFIQAAIAPTRALLRDTDPYVRKTAAIAVAKLYDHDRHAAEQTGLIEGLNNLLKDSNPTVVASALAALMDIWERNESIKLNIDHANASKIIQILPDCSE